MHRTFFSFVGSFFLIYIESYIVLLVTNCTTIDFGGIETFINSWAMNFFLLFSICTDIEMYLKEKADKNNTYSH